ncbi:MAG: hypothetical protein QM703_09755 [Gemmatales bacterium]
MRFTILIPFILLTALALLNSSATSQLIPSLEVDRAVDENANYFEKHIRPLFVQQCISCHGPQKQKGGLRMDSSAAIKKGGDSGSIIKAGHPGESLLYKAVSYQDDQLRMPPRGKLAAEQIDQVKRWIEDGAALPNDSAPNTLTSSPAKFDLKERLKYWSHQPIRAVSVPTIADSKWPITSIDPFIQAKWKVLDLHGAPKPTNAPGFAASRSI